MSDKKEVFKKLWGLEYRKAMLFRRHEKTLMTQMLTGQVTLPVQFFVDFSKLTRKTKDILEKETGEIFTETDDLIKEDMF